MNPPEPEPPATRERTRAQLEAAIDDWIDERIDPDRAINWWHGRRVRSRGRR